MADIKEQGYDLSSIPPTKPVVREENALGGMLPTEPSAGNTQVISKPGVSTEGQEVPAKPIDATVAETSDDSDSLPNEPTDVPNSGPVKNPSGSAIEEEAQQLMAAVESAKELCDMYQDTPMYPRYLRDYNEAVEELNFFKNMNKAYFEADGDPDDPPEEDPEDPDASPEEDENPEDVGTDDPAPDTPAAPAEDNLDDINTAAGDGDVAADGEGDVADDTAAEPEEPEEDYKDPEVDRNNYANSIRAKSFQKSLDNAKERMERATDPELKKRYKIEYEKIKEDFEHYKQANENTQKKDAESYKDMTEAAEDPVVDQKPSKKEIRKGQAEANRNRKESKKSVDKHTKAMMKADLDGVINTLKQPDMKQKLEKIRAEAEKSFRAKVYPSTKLVLINPSYTMEYWTKPGTNTVSIMGRIWLMKLTGTKDLDFEKPETKSKLDVIVKFEDTAFESICKKYLPTVNGINLYSTGETPLKKTSFFKPGYFGIGFFKDFDKNKLIQEEAIEYYEGGNDMGYFDDMSELFDGVVTEAANISDEMKPIIASLNAKGYKTKYSSPGYEGERSKKDQEPDGVRNGKLYSTARLMFEGDYNFGPAPKGWEWRQVDKNDYLDVKERTYNEKDGSPDEAFKKWKAEYMTSLKDWVADLPKAGSQNGDSSRNPDADSDHTEVRESAGSGIMDFASNMVQTFVEDTADDFTPPPQK